MYEWKSMTLSPEGIKNLEATILDFLMVWATTRNIDNQDLGNMFVSELIERLERGI